MKRLLIIIGCMLFSVSAYGAHGGSHFFERCYTLGEPCEPKTENEGIERKPIFDREYTMKSYEDSIRPVDAELRNGEADETSVAKDSNCVLKNMKGVTSNIAARVIEVACNEKYPNYQCVLKNMKDVTNDTVARVIANACRNKPPNYDCILENLKGVTSGTAAKVIYNACVRKYPLYRCVLKNMKGVASDAAAVAVWRACKQKECYMADELLPLILGEYIVGVMVEARACDTRFGGNNTAEFVEVLKLYGDIINDWESKLNKVPKRFGLTKKEHAEHIRNTAMSLSDDNQQLFTRTKCAALPGLINKFKKGWTNLIATPLVLYSTAKQHYPICN